MSATNIRALKDIHAGETVYVVGSGASLDYIDPTFFHDKVIVTINEAFERFQSPRAFALMHHHASAQKAINAGRRLVTTETDCGFSTWPRTRLTGDYFTYRTAENTLSMAPTINLGALERQADDELVISPCTAAEGVHFAAHLGARHIVLCGIDGGALDGRWNISGYNHGAGTNPQHVRLTEPLLLAVVDILRARGVSVMSLNPFINFGLEGHVYQRPPVLHGPALVRALNTVNYQETQS